MPDSGPACGDGVVNSPAEHCDQTAFQGKSCQSLGFASGALKCTLVCRIDPSDCRGLADAGFDLSAKDAGPVFLTAGLYARFRATDGVSLSDAGAVTAWASTHYRDDDGGILFDAGIISVLVPGATAASIRLSVSDAGVPSVSFPGPNVDSGVGEQLTVTPATVPSSLPRVSFVVVSLAGPDPSANTMRVLLEGNSNPGSNSLPWLWHGANGAGTPAFEVRDGLAPYAGSNSAESPVTPLVIRDSGPFVVTVLWFTSTQGLALRVNGLLRAPVLAPQPGLSWPTLVVGGSRRFSDPGHQFSGEVFDLLLYDRALTPTEIVGTEAYLAQRWGVRLE